MSQMSGEPAQKRGKTETDADAASSASSADAVLAFLKGECQRKRVPIIRGSDWIDGAPILAESIGEARVRLRLVLQFLEDSGRIAILKPEGTHRDISTWLFEPARAPVV